MKNNSLLLLFSVFYICIHAQRPSAKVDINMEGRPQTEVNEPGYTPWFIARVHTASTTISGVTFTLTATAPSTNTTFRAGWSKVLVQSPNFSRLVNDGIKIDNDTMLAYPGQGAGMELRISGLPVGKHILQTYHNIWEDTATVNYCPMNVYLNGNLVHNAIKRTVKVLSPLNATILLTELTVTSPGQEMVLEFVPDMNFTPVAGKRADFNIYLNAFELNTDDASKQAYDPYPANQYLHADADTGSLVLKWKPAINGYTQTHTIYFGTDSLSVANAISIEGTICKGSLPYNQQEYRADGLYSMNTYFWRVDQTDSSGLTTKGRIWSFRPRHLAFRGAEGYGRFATGGRGGKVVFVTNLNDAGPGSFRDAVTNGSGPRSVIFNVSGIITLDSKIFCDPGINIAGQTAPGKGICFRKSSLAIGSESICRFVRMRLGSGTSTDGMGLPGASESIMDHCSVSWSIDEGVTSRNAKNITVQKTLVSEALNMAGLHGDTTSRHGFAAVFGGDIASVHHNLLAHNSGRNPRFDGGMDGSGYYMGRVDFFNNVVYNWNAHSAYGEAHEVNFVNNYYKQGPATSKTIIFNADVNQRESNKGTESYYVNGNVLELKNKSLACDGSVFNCGITYTIHGDMVIDWEILVNQPFFPSETKVESAYAAYKSVLSDVGCTLPVFDDHDKRMINETMAGTYVYKGSKSGLPGIIDSETDAGGYENYPTEKRAADFDSDNDALPDWWENLHGSNPNSSQNDLSDTNADPDKDGFTSLDDYLEWMSVPHYYLSENGIDTIDLSRLTAGYTNNPTFSTVRSDNLTVIYKTNSAIISPIAYSTGINYIKIKVTDATGDTMVRTIGACVGVSEPPSIPLATSIKQKYKMHDEINFSVYPTLFDNRLNIEVNMRAEKSITVKMFDIYGVTLVHKNFDLKTGRNTMQLDCPENTPKKLYILKITDIKTGEALLAKKVIKK